MARWQLGRKEPYEYLYEVLQIGSGRKGALPSEFEAGKDQTVYTLR